MSEREKTKLELFMEATRVHEEIARLAPSIVDGRASIEFAAAAAWGELSEHARVIVQRSADAMVLEIVERAIADAKTSVKYAHKLAVEESKALLGPTGRAIATTSDEPEAKEEEPSSGEQ